MSRILYLIKRAYQIYKEGGEKRVIDRIAGKVDVYACYGYTCDNTKIELNEKEKENVGDTIIVNWIIPDLNIGSGGHMNIFRFITFLENMGIHNRIYLFQSNRFRDDSEFCCFLKEYYSTSLANDKIEVYNSTQNINYAQAVVATGWQTAYFVRRFENADHKFYFVQDFEPYFYPMGSEYLLAENTYKFGFYGITAGDWLKEKLNKEYGMKTESFHFSYDKELYHKKEKRDNVNRLFFYARPVTPRRAFELGLLSLIELYKRMPDIEVVFAGWDVSNYEIPFTHLNAGSVRLEELSDLYAQCDMCLVMSTTNLSLLPLEIMASNSVVVCSEGENNEWLVNDDNAIIVPYDPCKIADTLQEYLENKSKLEKYKQNGLEFVQKTSWEKEAQKVYNIIRSVVNGTEKTQ